VIASTYIYSFKLIQRNDPTLQLINERWMRLRYLLCVPVVGWALFIYKMMVLSKLRIGDTLYGAANEHAQHQRHETQAQPVVNAAEEHRPEGAAGFSQQRDQGSSDEDGDADHHAGNGNHERDEPHQSGAKVGWNEVLEKYRKLDARLRKLEERNNVNGQSPF
jgi:hypothetical protein